MFCSSIQRFLEVTDKLGVADLSVTPEKPLLWAFLMQNFNLGIAKMSVISESVTSENLCMRKKSVKAKLSLFLNLWW